MSTTFINRFEGSCGIFVEGKNNPLSSMTLGQFAYKIIINNHGVDVSMNIIII
jgi:hypothetical protein